jgi:hypothetical protein
MLKEYTVLIKVILLGLVVSGSGYLGYDYSNSKWEAKENAELLEVKDKLAELEKEKRDKEDKLRNEQTEIDNDDSAKVLALQATIVANESINSKLRSEIEYYKRMPKITDNSGVNREFAATATTAVLFAELFGRANERATALAGYATEAQRRGSNCEMKYEAVRKAYRL